MKNMSDVFLVCLCVFGIALVAELIMSYIGGISPWILVVVVLLSVPASVLLVRWRNRRDGPR
ncbi:hypothetical protein [Rothia uropygialis]|uniref:hypothetical protein n=1 Tax=Kocuria sp. 36 TaxID=1415402 RepID=UPI00101D190C|nr:hypothetical protein [Kocuria sp. 36]